MLILSLIRQCRDGRLNDPQFGSRMRGAGPFAELIRQRFQKASRRHSFDRRPSPDHSEQRYCDPRRICIVIDAGDLRGDGASRHSVPYHVVR